jgi:tetratricopeptide (TPR) repeat protein
MTDQQYIKSEAEMRALYHRLDVTLSTPGGSLTLGATVVHASDPARARELGVPPGLGLQLSELSAANKAAIQAYAEGMSPTLTVRTAPPRAVSTVDVDAAFAQAKRLLDRLEKNDVYGALEVLPEATDSIVQEKIAGIAATLGAAAKGAPAHKSARLEAALLALGRLSHALGDTLRRLEHDLMRGHIRADARLAAAKSGTGPSISELRRIWQQVAPDKVDRAAFLTRKAFTAKQRGDLDEAIRAANDALVENPFFDEFRPTLSSWERQKTERKDFGPGFASPVRVRR